METLPEKCATTNTVRSFCDCLAGAEPVDPAAKGFCSRVSSGDPHADHDEMIELKKALKDLEPK